LALSLTALFVSVIFFTPNFCLAANDGMMLSITPPLFKINMKPGEKWASTVKIVNNNNYAITISANVVDFKSGADGGVEFLKDIKKDSEEKIYLSQWVEITTDPISVSANTSAEIPFAINLPPNAGPGGHYAAILLGNSDGSKQDGTNVKITSKLASLLLVRVAGDIVEKGEIREFSNSRYFGKSLDAEFTVRFANDGNVHLHPQGEIRVYNMFGQLRHTIPINQDPNFGNILPNSEKKWSNLKWQGQSSIYDAGLMRAELLLSYGDENKQSEVSEVTFWAINLRPTLAVLGTVILFILLLVWLVRRYIRKSIKEIEEIVQHAGGNVVKSKSITTDKNINKEKDHLTVNIKSIDQKSSETSTSVKTKLLVNKKKKD